MSKKIVVTFHMDQDSLQAFMLACSRNYINPLEAIITFCNEYTRTYGQPDTQGRLAREMKMAKRILTQ